MMMNRVLLACLAVASIATTFAAPVHDVEEVVPEQVLTSFGGLFGSGKSTSKHDDNTENDCDYIYYYYSSLECNMKLEGQVKAQVAEQQKEMAKLEVEQKDATPLYMCHQMCKFSKDKADCDKCDRMAKEDKKITEKLRKKRMATMKKYMEKNKRFYDKMSQYARKDHDKFMNDLGKKFGHRFKNRAKKYLTKAKNAVMEKQREAKKA